MPPLSPRIWASIATGQPPEVHGIVNWHIYEDGRLHLYSSFDRRSPAIWNIASALGRTVGVVNWLTTYPAEAVKGFMVSDRYDLMWAEREAAQSALRARRELRRAVYPSNLIPLIGKVHGLKPPVVPNPGPYEAIDREVLRMAFAADREIPVELLLIYTRAFDEICHTGWYSHEPLPGMEMPEVSEFGYQGDLVTEYLIRFDWLLAEVLAKMSPEDHLVIVSDHGFEPNPRQDGLQGIHESERTATALLILAGPRIRRGVRLAKVSILDVMPTVLELAGLPSARNLPGEIVAEAFLDEERHFLPPVESYAQIQTTASGDRDSEADQAIMERLRALGYMGDDGAD
jgi:hypothetical protein